MSLLNLDLLCDLSNMHNIMDLFSAFRISWVPVTALLLAISVTPSPHNDPPGPKRAGRYTWPWLLSYRDLQLDLLVTFLGINWVPIEYSFQAQSYCKFERKMHVMESIVVFQTENWDCVHAISQSQFPCRTQKTGGSLKMGWICSHGLFSPDERRHNEYD